MARARPAPARPPSKGTRSRAARFFTSVPSPPFSMCAAVHHLRSWEAADERYAACRVHCRRNPPWGGGRRRLDESGAVLSLFSALLFALGDHSFAPTADDHAPGHHIGGFGRRYLRRADGHRRTIAFKERRNFCRAPGRTGPRRRPFPIRPLREHIDGRRLQGNVYAKRAAVQAEPETPREWTDTTLRARHGWPVDDGRGLLIQETCPLNLRVDALLRCIRSGRSRVVGTHHDCFSVAVNGPAWSR